MFLSIVQQDMSFLFLKSQLTVLKYSTPQASKLAAISLVVTTAAMGWPLPIGFPMVTMSGCTSEYGVK